MVHGDRKLLDDCAGRNEPVAAELNLVRALDHDARRKQEITAGLIEQQSRGQRGNSPRQDAAVQGPRLPAEFTFANLQRLLPAEILGLLFGQRIGGKIVLFRAHDSFHTITSSSSSTP